MVKRKKINCRDNYCLKMRFYVMSLWLLFILVFLLTVDIPISFAPNVQFIGVFTLLRRNALPLLSLLLAIVSWALVQKTEHDWKGVQNPPYRIASIKNENYEYLTFLTTYIIPLICINIKEIRYVIVLGILLILVGSIFVKMDLYYGNPALALLGYRIYRVTIEEVDIPGGVILISKDRLISGDYITWIKIDNFVWVAKEIEK